MQNRPPLPMAQGFVLCQRIYEDRRTGEVLLAGPFNAISLTFFPAGFRFALTFFLNNGHGAYQLALQLRDAEGSTVWAGQWPHPVHCEDPLSPHREVLPDVVATFPEPGRYDLVLVANGEDVASYFLLVTHARPE
jgi:hypothetical protein